MSRRASVPGARSWRDGAASELAARHVPVLGLRGPALVLEDPVDVLAAALESAGLETKRWWRRAVAGRPASPWPDGGRWATAALRLPRAKEELDMMVHAAASLLEEEGRLLVFGAKDEGAGSAGRRVRDAFRRVRSVATGGRCRLFLAEGPAPRSELRATLEDWGRRFAPGFEELDRDWISFPGVFAHGRVDGGTALLLDVLPLLSPGARVLDFGCGHGLVGAVVAARTPGADVVFLDVDAVALEAVRHNVPGARTVLCDGWSGAPPGPWDAVVSNPPYHRGKGESLEVLEDLVSGAAVRLAPGGSLTLVAQRRLPVERLLGPAFRRIQVLGDGGPWRVWRAGEPRAG